MTTGRRRRGNAKDELERRGADQCAAQRPRHVRTQALCRLDTVVAAASASASVCLTPSSRILSHPGQWTRYPHPSSCGNTSVVGLCGSAMEASLKHTSVSSVLHEGAHRPGNLRHEVCDHQLVELRGVEQAAPVVRHDWTSVCVSARRVGLQGRLARPRAAFRHAMKNAGPYGPGVLVCSGPR